MLHIFDHTRVLYRVDFRRVQKVVIWMPYHNLAGVRVEDSLHAERDCEASARLRTVAATHVHSYNSTIA
jgi:hypothetical protein